MHDRKAPKKVLLAPLNWGLGHATRSLPIARAMVRKGWDIHLASDGDALKVMRDAFPFAPYVELPAYGIRYSHAQMAFNLLRYGPRMYRAMRQERTRVRAYCREQGIRLIISDNRYGCRTPLTYNVLVAHQLHLRANDPLTAWIANCIQRQWMRPFDTIWVPDFPQPPGLGGDLSHPPILHCTRYIGPQSHLTCAKGASRRSAPNWDICALLSGPEPQRSRLETLLLKALPSLPGKKCLIRGLPGSDAPANLPDATDVTIFPYLRGQELSETLQNSKLVIARPGYSSLMDLSFLGGKLLAIPTPGQTEQIYLGEQLHKQGVAYCARQSKLNLPIMVPLALQTHGFAGNRPKAEWLEKAIEDAEHALFSH